MASNYWTEKETMAALGLYLLLDPRRISKTNPDICALAAAIDRTGSSVALKLWNLASLDKNRTDQGKVGMKHASSLDKRIWGLYENDQETYAAVAFETLTRVMKSHKKCPVLEEFEVELCQTPEGKERVALVRQRVNQSYFRHSLLSNYRGECCVTGISVPRLLVASHIKPWTACDDRTERLAANNGLLLNALHDRAFDQGLMTVDTSYHIHISPKVNKSQDPDGWLWSFNGSSIRLPKLQSPSKDFLEYHNDVIFQN